MKRRYTDPTSKYLRSISRYLSNIKSCRRKVYTVYVIDQLENGVYSKKFSIMPNVLIHTNKAVKSYTESVAQHVVMSMPLRDVANICSGVYVFEQSTNGHCRRWRRLF